MQGFIAAVPHDVISTDLLLDVLDFLRQEKTMPPGQGGQEILVCVFREMNPPLAPSSHH